MSETMRGQGDSLVQGVEDPSKDGIDDVPTQIPIFHILGGRWLLAVWGILGVQGGGGHRVQGVQ
jgi:hypothetical protein